MTNSLRSSALKSVSLAAGLLVLAGCGPTGDARAALDAKTAAQSAETAFAEGDYKTAVLCCRQSLEHRANQCDVLILLARAAVRAGDFETAEKAAADAAALRPGDLAVVQIGAQVAVARGDLETAYDAYTSLAKNEALLPMTRAIGWCGRGVVAMMRINTAGLTAASTGDAARIDFLRAIQADRRNASAYYHLGLLYRNTYGFKQAAIDNFERYVGLMGETVDPHVEKAAAAVKALKDEIADETAAIPGAKSRNPGACAVALKKADAALKKKDVKTAIRAYEEAAKADALSFDAVYNLAKASESLKTTAGNKAAFAAYSKAIKLRRGNAQALVDAGRLAEKLGKPISAVMHYSMAVALKWNDVTALDGLIRSLRKCGNRTAADAYQRFRDALSARK